MARQRRRIASALLITATHALAPPKVVVTGVGALTGVGNTYEETWSNILAGKTGIAPVDAFDEPERFGSTVGCQVRDFDGKAWFASPKTANANDRYTHLAMAAARQAYDDAKLNIGENADPDRVGVMKEVTMTVLGNGGKICDTRAVTLDGTFSVTTTVELPEDSCNLAWALQTKLRRLQFATKWGF